VTVLFAEAPFSRAWIAFAEGRYDVARSEIRLYSQITGQHGSVEAAVPLFAARCALLGHDAAASGQDLADVPDQKGRVLDADRTTVRAGIAALERRQESALTLYRGALQAWRDLGCACDEALCALDMASLLDPAEPEVRAAAERAREILSGLRAQPFLERLDARMGHAGASATASLDRAPSASAVAATQPAG
jgi:hypothetical protein